MEEKGLAWAEEGNEHVLGICWGPGPVRSEIGYLEAAARKTLSQVRKIRWGG